MTTTEAEKISKLINSLLVYSTMNRNACDRNDVETARSAAKWFNEAADECAVLGVHVIKFK